MILRWLGALVACSGAVVTAVLEAFLVPLRWGTVRLPVAVLLAVATNVALLWFGYVATGSKVLALLPGVAWMGTMIVASGGTSEGDIVMAGNNWVSLVTIVAGVAAYGFAGYRLVTAPPPRPPGRPGPDAVERHIGTRDTSEV